MLNKLLKMLLIFLIILIIGIAVYIVLFSIRPLSYYMEG